jgi:hypothetical protein
MDSTRRYDVISKLSFGDVWTNHDDSRDSGFGDDEWLPHDCSLKSTSGDKKIGIRLDFKDFLATSSLSSATMKTSVSNRNAQCTELLINAN